VFLLGLDRALSCVFTRAGSRVELCSYSGWVERRTRPRQSPAGAWLEKLGPEVLTMRAAPEIPRKTHTSVGRLARISEYIITQSTYHAMCKYAKFMYNHLCAVAGLNLPDRLPFFLLPCLCGVFAGIPLARMAWCVSHELEQRRSGARGCVCQRAVYEG
jgi:hypothetical protein